MKNITGLLGGFIFKIFVPFLFGVFIIIGFLCAVVSGLIEYEVFRSLFPNSDSTKIYFSIPFLIVIAFEVSKIFLIFLNKSYTESQNSAYIKSKKHFRKLTFILIASSVICTMIFTFFNLSNPEYKNNLTSLDTEINRKYSKLKNNILEEHNTQRDLQITSFDKEIQFYKLKMIDEENNKFRGSQEFRGKKYFEYKALKLDAEKRKSKFLSDLANKKEKKIYELYEMQNAELEQSKKQLKSFVFSGNKMLTTTLQSLNMDSEFPEVQYLLLVIFLSLLLSIGLEYIIWAAFTVLAIDYGDVYSTDVKTKGIINQHKVIQDTIVKMDKNELDTSKKRIKARAQSIVNDAKAMAKTFKNEIKNILK